MKATVSEGEDIVAMIRGPGDDDSVYETGDGCCVYV